jgi:GPH family glycoside/pentoside/hexuronide:cation symporter
VTELELQGSRAVADVAAPAAPERVSEAAAEERLPLSTIAIWAAPCAGTGFMFFLTSMYLMKFSTDVLGIAPAAMGMIFLVSRVWDAFSDPIAGYLSDNTRTRLGRRRPWLIAGALPVGAIFVLVWSPPASLGADGLAVWMGASIVLLFTALTVFGMPHASIGAELSTGYRDRSRVFGVRRIASGLGALVVFAAVGWLTRSANPRGDALTVALGGALVTSALILMTGLFLKERSEYQGRGGRNPLRAMGDVFRNPHARVLLLVFFLNHLALGFLILIAAYFAEYVLLDAGSVVLLMGTFFVVSIAAVPVWIGLGQRFDKKWLLIAGQSIVAVGTASFWLLGEGDVLLVCLISGACAVGAASLDVNFSSLAADVIDYDELRTGERKEGVYFSVWNLAEKSAMGIGGATVGFLLAASGFEPNAEQGQSSLLAIRAMESVIPAAGFIAGTLVFLGFRLTREAHAEIRMELDARGVSTS